MELELEQTPSGAGMGCSTCYSEEIEMGLIGMICLLEGHCMMVREQPHSHWFPE